MYSEAELEQAVRAGIISEESAVAFRNYIAQGRSAPTVDEEHFRLLTGFNDIFVSIATALILIAVAWIGSKFGFDLSGADNNSVRGVGIGTAAAGISVAITSWVLAEYFTLRRRMALPSILLLLGFASGTFLTIGGTMAANVPWLMQSFNITTDLGERQLASTILLLSALVTAGATWFHWRRFMVPITMAIAALAAVATLVGALLAIAPTLSNSLNPILLVAGIVLFFVAMRWDSSDRERRTRRSDVAFWLHLAAAPLIAHPVFKMLGVFDGNIGVGTAGLVLVLYTLFSIIALAVDRRALLVSSLIYVLWAMYALFEKSGAVELAAALTALVIGSALLSLSAYWHTMRVAIVSRLGELQAQLPPTQQTITA